MSAKLLISGLSNSGKTSLTQSLENAFVASHDGKSFPFPVAHTNISDFQGTDDFIATITEKFEAYNSKMGHYPSTLVIDSVSKVFDTLMDMCNTKYTGFSIYSNLDKEVRKLNDFIQNSIIDSDISAILISHAVYDNDTEKYSLVGKGSFQKRGGFLSEVDNAIFLETKGSKRIVHHRSTKFPARTVIADYPDNQEVQTYSLQEHITALASLKSSVKSFEL